MHMCQQLEIGLQRAGHPPGWLALFLAFLSLGLFFDLVSFPLKPLRRLVLPPIHRHLFFPSPPSCMRPLQGQASFL